MKYEIRNKKNKKINLFPIFTFHISYFIFLLFASCESPYSPKPRAFFRIDLPEKKYQEIDMDCPFVFEIPVYSKIISDDNPNTENCWFNIDFPKFHGRLHLSYKPVNNNIGKYLEDSRTLVYKHTVRATDIREEIIRDDSAKVYGLIYDIKGNVASSLQFYLTDSTHHFLRASLYFNAAPNSDSIAPVLNFVREDIYKMIESFEWKKK